MKKPGICLPIDFNNGAPIGCASVTPKMECAQPIGARLLKVDRVGKYQASSLTPFNHHETQKIKELLRIL